MWINEINIKVVYDGEGGYEAHVVSPALAEHVDASVWGRTPGQALINLAEVIDLYMRGTMCPINSA